MSNWCIKLFSKIDLMCLSSVHTAIVLRYIIEHESRAKESN
jgi:hypothetical protein